MTRPSSSGESLEAILASIRRSLAEQATAVLDEEAVAPAEPAGLEPQVDMAAEDYLDVPPVPQSLSQQLAAVVHPQAEKSPPAASEPPVPSAELPRPAGELVPEPTIKVVAAPAPGSEPVVTTPTAPANPATETAAPPLPVDARAAAGPARTQTDPLWFLAHDAAAKSGEQATNPTPPARSALNAPAARAPASEPQRQQAPEPGRFPPADPIRGPQPRPGVERGPLPPFFGSSAEAWRAESTSDAPSTANRVAVPPPPPGVSPAPAEPLRVPPRAPAADAERANAVDGNGLGGNSPEGWPRAVDTGTPPGVNGKPGALFGLPAAEQRPVAGDAAISTQLQALEVMVAELLRPMLRRWLDENMPRLVSAALKAEAQLMSERDRKKS